jgi:signal transduction histidine kinase
MEKIWSTISYLGLKDNSESASKRDVILTNRINFVIFMLAVLLTIVTTVIRELNQSEFTIHTKKILVLMIFCGFSFLFSAKGLFALTKINLVFTPLFVIILLPIFFGAIQQMDFIYGPIIILSLSLIPQLVLDPQRERKIYFFTLLFFLLVVALFDNLLVYFSPDELPITTVTHSFHEYYKTVFISSFLFFHAALFYLREQAFKYERELKTVNLILEQQRDEIADKNEELEQQHEEILTQSHELETINRHLEERVIAELSKNRKKDVMLIQQSRQAAMGEMIGNIAHQWRQPLSAVAVIIQNIQEAYNYNEINREYLENKVKQSMELIDYMSQTIDDFRNFFKPEKSPSIFNVREVVNKCISFVRETLRSNNIEYEFHASEDIFVKGFSNEYSQVVLNLISNAKDILVERKMKNPKIEITLFRKEEKSYLYVADNGGGIAPEIKEKIFTPYFTTKEQAMGTGIGLYMSKTIIEKNMGGSLTFMDIEGGTEFCVVL